MTRSRKKPKADPAVAKLTEDPINERTPVQKYLAEIERKGEVKGRKPRASKLSRKVRA
jgi:hypothetical protein